MRACGVVVVAKAMSGAERSRILELHAEGWARNAIAREVGRSPGSVSTVVHDAGGSFERVGEVAEAITAKVMDNKAKRARLEELLLDDALALREQLWQPALVYNFGGKDNTYEEHQLDRPDFAGQAAIMRTVGVAIDKAVRLADVDKATTGASEAKGILGALAESLQVAYAQLPDETPDDED